MTIFEEALRARRAAIPPDTDAFRWIDEELPDVTVDLFGDVAILSLYRAMPAEEELALATELSARAERELRAVYLKRRPREARRVANEDSEAVAPRTPIVGAPVEPFTVHEAGIRYEIRPANGLSVGLYLDARNARSWVRDHSRGRTVLNLFAYTCGFGVAARLGGATRAVNVDTSRKVLDWGERNAALNELTVDRRDFISGDALDWLGRFAKKNERFDLIVLDPPGFATTRESRFSAARDYHRLVAATAAVTSPGGLMLAICNVAAMDASAFDAEVKRGLGSRGHRILERFGASPIDFRSSALKCVALELA